MKDCHQEIWDTMEAFMEECREHRDVGYAMASGYLQSMVRSLLHLVPRDRQEQELRWMREFIREKSHARTINALKQVSDH